MSKKYSVTILCKYLACSRSGYYDWIKRGKPEHNKLDEVKKEAILSVYNEKKTRGRRQVKMFLSTKFDIHMSLGSVHRYMKILNLRSIMKNMPKNEENEKKEEVQNPKTFANVLNRDFCTSKPSHKWLTDVTYIPCTDGTLFLSCIKDMFDKSIIAYYMSKRNDTELVMKTLYRAEHQIGEDTILHSDQGSQYVSKEYQAYLKEKGITGSMSRKGTPYDNSPMESFFSLLKNEELKLYGLMTMKQTEKVVDEYIRYYNKERPQWGLKKQTPHYVRSLLSA